MTPPPSHQDIIIPNECLMDSSCCNEYNWLFHEGFFPFQSNCEGNPYISFGTQTLFSPFESLPLVQEDYEEETNSSPTESTSAVQEDYEADQIVRCCSNCDATRTPVWRKNKSGDIVCNACGQ